MFTCRSLCLTFCLLGWFAVSAFAEAVAPPGRTGLLPPSAEEKAWAEAHSHPVTFTEKELKELPARVVNLEHLPPVRSQIIGSCASWSVVYYVKGWQEAKKHGITRPFPEEHVLSPAFVFQWVGISAQAGSTFEANFRFLERHGTVTWDEFPEHRWLMQSEAPSVDLWKGAARRRSAPDSLGTIPTDTEAGLAAAKAVLAGGELISTGVGVWANFDNYPANDEGVDSGVFFAEGTVGRRDNHAVTLIGYDDNISYHNGTEQRQGAFLAVNSWGTGWGVSAVPGGEGGYVWLAYEYFLNNRGAPRLYSFYTMQNREDYTPRHFAILDMEHPRRVEISLGLQSGVRDELASGINIMPPGGGMRPLTSPIAFDITELITAGDEAFWVRVFDVIVPSEGPRDPATIHGITIEQEGRPPLVAVEGLPLQPKDQLSLGTPSPEWIPISPTLRHEETFPPHGMLVSEGATWVSADVGDIFGDGALDIVALGGLLRMEDGRPVAAGEVHVGRYALGDYDNDGLPDLAIAGTFDGSRELRLFRNRGNGQFAEEAVLPPTPDTLPLWVDFNGNGRLDLVVLDYNNPRVLLNKGNGIFRDSGLNLPGPVGRVTEIVDFDQDGLMDFGGWRNLGNGQWEQPPWAPGSTLAWGDYTGNGLLDAAVVRQDQIDVYRNDGDGRFTPAVQGLPGFYNCVLRWGDVNNNGLLDIVAAGNTMAGFAIATNARTEALLQQDDGTFLPSGFAIHGHGLSGTLVLADFDEDGDIDFLSGGYPSMPGTSFSASVPRDVRYTENRHANPGGREVANEPPSAPSGLAATPGSVPGSVTLRWNDSTDDRTPPSAMRYQLRVGTSAGGSQIASPAHSLAAVPAHRLSPAQAGRSLRGLAAGQYYWSVRAMDASGAFSPWSQERGFLLFEGAPPEPLYDPNKDGVFDGADVAFVAGLIGSSQPADLARADVDGTGSVTANDAAELARLLTGRGGAPTPPWIATVDRNGGELVLGDAHVVVPAGAITGEPANMRLQKMNLMSFGSTNDYNHEPYRLSGIPLDLEKPIEVSLYNPDWWRDEGAEPLLAIGEDGFAPTLGTTAPRYRVVEPERYENHTLHFRIEPLEPDARKALREKEDFVEGEYSTDYWVLGGYSHYTTPNFRVSFPRSYSTEVVEQLANDLEHAHARYRSADMGFSYAARTKWPLSVTLKDLGATTYGYAYSSRRGPNYGGMEFNTRLMSNAAARRVTAFHEFFHIVEAFYDPRNRVRAATFMSPHHTLSEMAATWVEQFAVSNPAIYVPSEWHAHRFELFDPIGLDLPPEVQTDLLTRNVSIVSAHGYGWSALIRWLALEHGNTVLRDIFTHVRGGQNWVRSIGLASGDSTFLWFHRFMIAYTLGEVYAFTNEDRADVIGPDRLYISETNLSRTFTQPMRNLSAKLYGVNVSGPAMASGFIKPEHRLGFRLEAPLGARLSIISQEEGKKPNLEEIVGWSGDVLRHITGSAHPVLSKPDSFYFALVTHDKGSPRHAEPEEFKLMMALVEDKTLDMGPLDFGGFSFYDGSFPPMSSADGTVLIPAAANIVTMWMSAIPTYVINGVVWEDEETEFEVSAPVTFPVPSMPSPDGNYTWEVSHVEGYRLELLERHGPGSDDLVIVQTLRSSDGSFKFKPHVFEGRMEWSMSIRFTVTSTHNVTEASTDHPFNIPLVFFMGDAL